MRFSRPINDPALIEPGQQPLTGPAMLLKSMLGIDPNMIMQAISEIMAGVKAMNEALARIERRQEEIVMAQEALECELGIRSFHIAGPPHGPGNDGAGDRSTGSEG